MSLKIFDVLSIYIFILIIPPGILANIAFGSQAQSAYMLITFLLVLYWIFRILHMGPTKYRNLDLKILTVYMVASMVSYLTIGLIHYQEKEAIIGMLRIGTLIIAAYFIWGKVDKELLVDSYLAFCLLGSIAVFIGLIYSQLFESTFQFTNPDGRPAELYLSSVSNSVYYISGIKFPRMSFLFDEAGTISLLFLFAYLVCDVLGRYPILKYIFVLSGFAVFSLAFFILISFYEMGKIFSHQIKLKQIAILFGIVLFLFFVANNTGDVFRVLLIDRLMSFGDGGVGDTRSSVLSSAINAFMESMVYGVGFNEDGKYSFFGANILYFLAIGGLIFGSLYFVLGYFIVRFILQGKILIGLVVAFAFFQRPDWLAPYAFISLVVLYFAVIKLKIKRSN